MSRYREWVVGRSGRGGSPRTFGLRDFVEESPGITVTILVVASMSAAWLLRFIQDDAFISFRYALNLADGHGLVFQPGERVQGFTNPLWTLIMAIPHALDVNPVVTSQVIGILCLGGTVAITFHIARLLLKSSTGGLVSVLVMVGTVTFTAYGSGGLETSMQTLLVTSVAWLALRQIDDRDDGPVFLLTMSFLAGVGMVVLRLANPEHVCCEEWRNDGC